MDAVLRTNSERNSLALRDLKLFSDGSGGTCTLEVRSGGFAATVPFFFDPQPWANFLEKLQSMERNLQGSAKLGLNHEEPFIQMTLGNLGQLDVSGLLVEYTDRTQRLEFSFRTDQTALGGFASDLMEVARGNAA